MFLFIGVKFEVREVMLYKTHEIKCSFYQLICIKTLESSVKLKNV